jgi:hypothetical protein
MGRVLTQGERTLAEAVFGSAIRLERVRVSGGGFGRFAVTIGSRLCLPANLRQADFAVAPLAAQALFVHELVHVWQFQTQPLPTLASWAKAVVSGGYGPGLPAYRYPLPLPAFERLGLERQASVVEHAFLLQRGARSAAMPAGASVADYSASPFPVVNNARSRRRG